MNPKSFLSNFLGSFQNSGLVRFALNLKLEKRMKP